MPAATRAHSPLRAQLSVESLEGRIVPVIGISQPMLGTALVATPQTNCQNTHAVKIVSQIFVNGKLVLKVQGKPQFAGIGSAASGNQNGQTETGGTTIYANGQAVGTFQGPPQITRTAVIVFNKHGEPVRVMSYHITGTPYLAPTTNSAASAWHTGPIGGLWVG